jgi:universal stress protein E
MITRGRSWQPHPRFAAAVDVSPDETPGLARAILSTASYLAAGCGGDLDVVYSQRACNGSTAALTAENSGALHHLAGELGVKGDHVHVLAGSPDSMLPAFASEQHFDAIVLGALSHRPTLSTLVGTLTGSLVDAIDCDFVLVKPGTYACPVPSPQPTARA